MDASDVNAAWAAIATTAAAGKFVPVIGFDVAASTAYADARPMTVGTTAPPPSAQTTERTTVYRRLAAIRSRVDRAHNALAVNYVDAIHQNDDPVGVLLTDDDPLLDFETSIVQLAAALTFEWAAKLSREPAPLTSGYTISLVEQEQDDAMGHIRRTLDAALALRGRESLPGTLSVLDTHWIYVKLLLFVAETVGSSPSFWQGAGDQAFVARHKAAINDLTNSGVRCGWDASRSGIPLVLPLSSARENGVEYSHLVWLEELLWFLLLSQTRAYRTRSQIAFALSLDDEGTGIPRLPADPFEMGLLYSRLDLREIEALARIMKHSCEGANGHPRPPGAFHQAIAKLFRKQSTNRVLEPPIIFVLGMDLEMERALAIWFESYRVLVPVYLPLKSTVSGDAAESARFLDNAKPSWLLLQVTRVGPDEHLQWSFPGGDSVLAGEGPIVIKFFGSPAHDLPALSECGSTELAANYDITKPIIHRLVLDELELMKKVTNKFVERDMPGLFTRFTNSMFFLFGDDALSWGDRAPYLIPDVMRSSAPSIVGESAKVSIWDQEGTANAEGAGTADESSQGQGESPGTRGSSGHPMTMATAHRGDQFVQGMWRQLNVAAVGSGDGGSITNRIVTEVAKW